MPLNERILTEICTYAADAGVQKVILFGSRARRTNRERSDIDLAVEGGNFEEFYWNVKNNLYSLLKVDLVNMNDGVPEELKNEIKKDGVVIYEKN